MSTVPNLHTSRLRLRRLELADAALVRRLAGDWRVAATIPQIPHPYPEGVAEAWISLTHEQESRGTGVQFAVVAAPVDTFMGVIALGITPEHGSAVLGYWLGHAVMYRGDILHHRWCGCHRSR